MQPHAYLSASPSSVSQVEVCDNSLAFLQRRMLTYMDRLLKANLNLDKEAFEFLHFVLSQELATEYFKSIKELVPEQRRKEINEAGSSIEELSLIHI